MTTNHKFPSLVVARQVGRTIVGAVTRHVGVLRLVGQLQVGLCGPGHVGLDGGASAAFGVPLGWKLMSCSHGQELGQLSDLASDWLIANREPACMLTQLSTMATT